MIVVFGGAYQGKTEFVKETFSVTNKDIFVCGEDISIEEDVKVIAHLERFIYACIKNKISPIKYFEENEKLFENKIIICDDICCGVVPLGKDMRLYRDNVGKQLQIFCRNAQSVYRVFCGIGERIK